MAAQDITDASQKKNKFINYCDIFITKKIAFGSDFLPPYAPEYNPDELAGTLLKARIAKAIAKPKNKLKLTVESASHRLQNLPDIVASVFHSPS